MAQCTAWRNNIRFLEQQKNTAGALSNGIEIAIRKQEHTIRKHHDVFLDHPK